MVVLIVHHQSGPQTSTMLWLYLRHYSVTRLLLTGLLHSTSYGLHYAVSSPLGGGSGSDLSPGFAALHFEKAAARMETAQGV